MSETGAEPMSSKAPRVAVQWDLGQLYQLANDTIFKTIGSIHSITLFLHMIDRFRLNTGHLLTFTCLLLNDQRPNIIIQLVHASLRLCCQIRSGIWNVSYIELRIWNQVSHDHYSFERNLSNCEQKPEKVRTSTGFEPVTSRYRCDDLTNWAMTPLTLGTGHFWVIISPWRMDVTWYMKCGFIAQLVRVSHREREVTGSNPVEVLTFSGFCSQLLKLRSKLWWSWLTCCQIRHVKRAYSYSWFKGTPWFPILFCG